MNAEVKEYQKHGGDTIRLNFGASGDLANQIIAGAPVDLFISAGSEQIAQLSRANRIDRNASVLACNELVLVVPADVSDGPTSWQDLIHYKRIAIGDPKSVPAGKYATEVFAHMKLSEQLSGKIIYGSNVRQVLAYVERGEVDAGVVYSTDARQAGSHVHVAAVAPDGSHEPIQYPAVIVRDGNKPAAEKFLGFLFTPTGQEILLHYGFLKGSR
jgi:molybdate transport system substrate-binding protein